MNRSAARPATLKNRAGFTLIELLVCLVIIAALVSMALTQLSQVRAHAQRVKTRSNMGQVAALLHLYADDWRDSWPALYAPTAGPTSFVAFNGQTIPVQSYFAIHDLWRYALADGYFDGNAWPEVVFDAQYPRGQPRGGFAMSCSLFADHRYWNDSTWTGPTQWRSTRRYETLYPQSKMLLVSSYAFQGPNLGSPGRVNAWQPVVAVTTVDGAARHLAPWRIIPGRMRGDGPFPGVRHQSDVFAGLHTQDGVRGRDLR